MSKNSIQGKVVIVTGASSGIGRALAQEYAAMGAHVVLAARSAQKIDDLASSLPVKALAVPTDVSDPLACESLINSTIDTFGKIDILINNAGISMRALFEDLDLKVLREVMEINFWGTVYCTKFALPHILREKGSIIGVSSVAGFRGLPGRTGYTAAKFAMNGFMESLRTELLYSGVHVMIACPGFTSTNIRNTALTRTGEQQGSSPRNEGKMVPPEKVAMQIRKAIEKRKRTLILTSQGWWTVFFNKWLPGWMDKMVYRHFTKEDNSPLPKQ